MPLYFTYTLSDIYLFLHKCMSRKKALLLCNVLEVLAYFQAHTTQDIFIELYAKIRLENPGENCTVLTSNTQYVSRYAARYAAKMPALYVSSDVSLSVRCFFNAFSCIQICVTEIFVGILTSSLYIQINFP